MTSITTVQCQTCKRHYAFATEAAVMIDHKGECIGCLLTHADQTARGREQLHGYRVVPCAACITVPSADCPRCKGSREAYETLDGEPLPPP